MSLRQPWLWLVLAGCAWGQPAQAQTGTNTGGLFGNPSPGGTTTNPGGTTTNQSGTKPNQTGGTKPAGTGGTSDTTTSDTTPGTDTPTPPPKPATPPTTEPGTKPANPFGFDALPEADPNATRPSILTPQLGPNGASSTFGSERPGSLLSPFPTGGGGQPTQTPSKPLDNPTTYNAPGFFGRGQQGFTAGEGRFAKPRFRYGGSLGMGFDDNYQQTPDHTGREATSVEQIIPAVTEISQIQQVQVPTGVFTFHDGQFSEVLRTENRKVILRPGQPEQRVQVPIPGVPSQPRLSSIISTVDVYFDTQWAKAREALTFDVRLGADYYFDREKDPLEYNGNLSLFYLRKLSAKAQFTANANLTHQSQPDYSQVNVSTSQAGGAYTTENIKFDLSYRWAPRFSTDTSLSSSGIFYDSGGASAVNNFYDVTLGNEFRYIFSRKTTYVAEVRYTDTQYTQDPTNTRNSDTLFLLIGEDQKWNRRLTSSVRLGGAARTFAAGDKQTSPYGELTVNYQPSSRSQFGLFSRYGFEATNAASEKNITLRTNVNYTRAFTPRFSGTLGLNYVTSEVTSTLTNTSSQSETFDGTLGFNYKFNRRFSMNTRYSYTMLKSNLGFSDYDRSRLFLTGSYDF